MSKFEELSRNSAVTDKDKALLIIKQHISREISADAHYIAEALLKVWREIDAKI
jgi:hypothetical protein